MTDVTSATPEPPPPPPDDAWEYTPPLSNGVSGPPPWPPQYSWSPSQRPRRSFLRTAAMTGAAFVAIAAGSGAAAFALSGRNAVPTATNTPATQGSSSTPSSSSPAATESLAQVEQAVVDINGVLAGGQGQVAGTGMVITPSGEVLTNNHVIEGTQSLTVQIDGTGPTYTATVVGDDPSADVALLQIQGVSNLPTVVIGSASSVSVGDSITAIGNALGRGGTPATAGGTVTALDQTVTASDETGGSETLSGTIQIAASIEPGDSGGPVVNSSGQVIGMTTAGSTNGRFSDQFSATTAGFAIAIDQAMSVVHEIQAGGAGDSSVHIGAGALLGVEVDTQSATGGAAVVGVQAGSPAAAAGLTAGDTIIRVGGATIASSNDLRSVLERHSPGQTVSVVWTDASGGQHSANVKLASGPPA
jgi:S1-C subfamily serine protease